MNTQYANHLGYSDVNPYEVVKVVSGKTLEIRSMTAEKDDSVKLEFQAGGFSAHCSNQQKQKWFINSNPDGEVKRIRLSKNGKWFDKYGNRFSLSDKPVKFYDYNF